MSRTYRSKPSSRAYFRRMRHIGSKRASIAHSELSRDSDILFDNYNKTVLSEYTGKNDKLIIKCNNCKKEYETTYHKLTNNKKKRNHCKFCNPRRKLG